MPDRPLAQARSAGRRRVARARLAAIAVGAVLVGAELVSPATGAAQRRAQPVAPPPTLGPAPFGFLRTPTDQLAVPGLPAGTNVTPETYFYTGWAELLVRVGRQPRPVSAKYRTLEDGRLPIIRALALNNRIRYELTALSSPVGSRAVNFIRVEMTNLHDKPRDARVMTSVSYAHKSPSRHGTRIYRPYRFGRPSAPLQRLGHYFQPGVEFNPSFHYSFSGRDVVRDGMVLYDFPAARRPMKLSRTLQPQSGPPGHPTEFGQTDYRIKLPPRQRVRLDFRMPVEPLPVGSEAHRRMQDISFDAARRRVRTDFGRLLRSATRIDVPERKVEDAFYASLTNMALPRYRQQGAWIQPVNKLRYHAFWLRDAAIMNHSFLLAGLSGVARQNLPFFLSWQAPDGLFISRSEEFDGFGQTLWAFGDYVQRTGDTAMARTVYEPVRRAMDWFMRRRAADPLRIMPAASPSDNEDTSGHITGDNFWAFAGVQQAIALARAVGRQDDAARWQAELADFRAALGRAVAAAAGRAGGAVTPTLDTAGGQDWGNYWLAYPAPVFSPSDPVVTATLRRARGRFREGLATYGDGAFLHHYLSFRVWQTELLRGEQAKAVGGLYDALAHTTATHAGFETGIGPFGERVVDSATVPHGWFAAELVALIRNMLVRERFGTTYLGSALSPSWLDPGETVAVSRAPTVYGPVSFTLRSRRGGATLSWQSGLRRARLVFVVPANARNVNARGLARDRRTILLRGSRGTIDITWRLAGRRPTYETVFRSLLRQYRARRRYSRAHASAVPPPAAPARDVPLSSGG